MKKIVLLRSQDIFSDSRVLKYEKWFNESKLSYKIVGWDRLNQKLIRENTTYYYCKAGFQQRSRAIFGRIKWDLFLAKYLFKNRKNYDVVHACDFDTVLPALLMKYFFGKKVIFDIFDWFSDEVKTGKAFIDIPINILERLSVKLADLVIICETERLKQMKTRPKKYIVIPNIPDFSFNEIKRGIQHKDNQRIVISYVGGIVENRGLKELVDAVKGYEKYFLNIGGYGDQELEKYIENTSLQYPNIHYWGKVSYKKALQIMQESDLLYAMYYKGNPNNVYAAPNKYYESLFLHKPILTTEGTLVGNKVKKYNTGFVIEEGYENLKYFLKQLEGNDLKQFEDWGYILNKEIDNKNKELCKYKAFVLN